LILKFQSIQSHNILFFSIHILFLSSSSYTQVNLFALHDCYIFSHSQSVVVTKIRSLYQRFLKLGTFYLVVSSESEQAIEKTAQMSNNVKRFTDLIRWALTFIFPSLKWLLTIDLSYQQKSMQFPRTCSVARDINSLPLLLFKSAFE